MRKIRIPLIMIFLITCGISIALCQQANQAAKEHYRKGELYFQQGNYELAQEEFQKALELLGQKEKASVVADAKKAPAKAKKSVWDIFGSSRVKPEEKAEEKTKPAMPDSASQPDEYVIGLEDEISISIWDNPDLFSEVFVRPDGRISCPLIGDVVAAGRTIPQVDAEMTERLKEYIKFPEVTVSIKKIGGRRFVVLGEVLGPGVYTMPGIVTIWDAIGMAGGFTNDAVTSSIILVRGGFTNPKAERLSLNRALRGDARYNIAIQPQDVIYVPKKFIADLNYALNQIMQPLSQGTYMDKQLHYWHRQRIWSGEGEPPD